MSRLSHQPAYSDAEYLTPLASLTSAELCFPALQVFGNAQELYDFTTQTLKVIDGKSLVLVTGSAALADILPLDRTFGRRVQSVTSVPAQVNRPNISVATFSTACRLAKSPYGQRQLDISSFDLLMLHNPHRLALKALKHIADIVRGRPVMIGVLRPNPSETALLSELFLGEMKASGPSAFPAASPPYTPEYWAGTRHTPNWQNQRNCTDAVPFPGAKTFTTAYYREVRRVYCPGCPVADSCLAEGLDYTSRQLQAERTPSGAWGGLSSYARRELAIMLGKGATPAQAAHLISRARQQP